MVEPLPRRLGAADHDLSRGRDAAHAIAAATLGRDPGPMTTAASMSHYVYLGADVAVKLVDAGGHTRLDREIALSPHLPAGLGAPLLASGRFRAETCEVRYACFTRLPGVSAGVGLPGVEAVTARRWTEQAVRLLNDLHGWKPTGDAERALAAFPAHEGFTSRSAMMADIERLSALPRHLIDGLRRIADRAPLHLRAEVPVHADGDWGNWLAHEHDITALMDFERARMGEPADDWVLLALGSGPHVDLVLDVIAEATATDPEALRAACELRDAAVIAEDLRSALEQSDPPPSTADLERLITGRFWWQPTRLRS